MGERTRLLILAAVVAMVVPQTSFAMEPGTLIGVRSEVSLAAFQGQTVTRSMNASQVMDRASCFLTETSYVDINSYGEHAYCSVDKNSFDWSLTGSAEENSSVYCKARCLIDVASVLEEDGRYSAEAHNGQAQIIDMVSEYSPDGHPQNKFCYLTGNHFEDLDDGNEIGRCSVKLVVSGNQVEWKLEAKADDDADAWCTAECLESVPESVEIAPYALLIEAHNGETVRHLLGPKDNKACFLKSTAFQDTDNQEKAGCRIISAGDNYYLEAESQGSSDAWCSSFCVEWEGPGPLTPPPARHYELSEGSKDIPPIN